MNIYKVSVRFYCESEDGIIRFGHGYEATQIYEIITETTSHGLIKSFARMEFEKEYLRDTNREIIEIKVEKAIMIILKKDVILG